MAIYRAAWFVAACATVGLAGCQSAPPMSKERFAEAARKCRLNATTYTYRDGLFLDEPLIDFSRERNSRSAITCFTNALEQIDRAMTERGAEHIGYIWEWRT